MGDNISTGMGLIILAISIIVAASILKPNNQQEEIFSGRYELENGVIFDTATGNLIFFRPFNNVKGSKRRKN